MLGRAAAGLSATAEPASRVAWRDLTRRKAPLGYRELRPGQTAIARLPLMIGAALTALALLGIAAVPAATDEPDTRDTFFARLSALCGEAFEGYSNFPEDGPFAGKLLRAEIAECGENEIRIPFAVGEDRSRTWIVSRGDRGLLLKHDHRREDGKPDEITMYGGWATVQGSGRAQSFEADDHTRELIPDAATNVWTLELGPEGDELAYSLDRHGKPRFRATLERNASGAADRARR